MSARRDLRHGVRIGRAEFVRSLRQYVGDVRRVAALVLLVLVFGGNLLVSLPGIYLLGRRTASVASIPHFETVATVLPVGVLVLAGLRTVERIAAVDSEELLLTTVHPRAVVVGLLTAEGARLALWFGIPVLAVVGAFVAGVGAPSLALTLPVVALPLVCCTAVWGYAVGIAVLRGLRRLPTFRRVLKLGGVVALVGLVVLSQVAARSLVDGELSVEAVASALSFPPLAEYVSLAFVGTPLSTPVTPAAMAVLAAWVGLTPVGLAVAVRQATALWFTDDPARSASSRRPKSVTGGGFSPPRPFAWRRAGRIAWGHLVRAVRHPQKLSHLVMLVFFVGPLGGSFLGGSTGDGLPIVIAGGGVLFGVYLSGATFGLNPLGDDRPQLPVVLLTETSPGTFLRGRALAGLAVGLPLAVLVPMATVAVGTRPVHAVAFAALGTVFSVLAALVAPGLGCAYPIYEERQLWGTETVAPSMLVLIGYSIVVIGGTMVGLVVGWFTVTGHLALTIALAVGLGAYALPTLGVPILSYWYARRRYRRYVLD